MPMQTGEIKNIDQALVAFFEEAAQRNAALMIRLKAEQCFDLSDIRWRFTLPDLYHFLQQGDEVFEAIDYKTFRKIVFSSPVNQRVTPYGAEIEIADNLYNVDLSTYALVWAAKD